MARVAFTYLNSLLGLRTRLCFGEPILAGVCMSIASRSYVDDETPPPFADVGKKLVTSVVSRRTDFASNGEKKLVVLDVVFKLESDTVCDAIKGICAHFDYIYPYEIRDVDTDPSYVGRYTEPTSLPPYAKGSIIGMHKVWFANEGKIILKDSTTGIKTLLRLSRDSYIVISMYKAVRNDMLISSPFIEIYDPSGKPYYW